MTTLSSADCPFEAYPNACGRFEGVQRMRTYDSEMLRESCGCEDVKNSYNDNGRSADVQDTIQLLVPVQRLAQRGLTRLG